MLQNATLLRVDDPPPADPGAPISIRCAMVTPTSSELAAAEVMGIHPVAVVYLPMLTLPPSGEPVAGQRITMKLDACPTETYAVAHAADHVGDVLTHVQVFLIPVEE